MELILLVIIIPALLFVAALFFIYFLKLPAVVICSLLGAAYVGWAYAALKGFGSPTGHVSATSFGEWLGVTLWALVPISVLLLAYYFLLQVLKNDGPVWPLGLAILGLLGMFLLYQYPPNTWFEEPEPRDATDLRGKQEETTPEWVAAVSDRYREAMNDATAIPAFLEFTEHALEADPDADEFAFEIADFCTKLMIERLRAEDFDRAERVFHAYTEIFLPLVGPHRKTEDVASMGLVLSTRSERRGVAESVFEKLLPAEIEFASIQNDVLLYNLASHYAVAEDRANLLRAARAAVARGKSAAQFLEDPDFANYLEDTEFRAIIGAAE